MNFQLNGHAMLMTQFTFGWSLILSGFFINFELNMHLKHMILMTNNIILYLG